jgi:hypothetical protein
MLAGELHIASDPELEADRFALLRERLREVGDGAAITRRFTASAATSGSAAARSS